MAYLICSKKKVDIKYDVDSEVSEFMEQYKNIVDNSCIKGNYISNVPYGVRRLFNTINNNKVQLCC